MVSNWARVMTVLQFGSAALSADAFSHRPLMVMTGASGATFDASASLFWAGLMAPPVGAPDCPVAGVDVGLAAWPQAMAPNSRQTKPYRVMFNDSSKEDRKGQSKS